MGKEKPINEKTILEKLQVLFNLVEVMKKEKAGHNYNYVEEEALLAKLTVGMAEQNIQLLTDDTMYRWYKCTQMHARWSCEIIKTPLDKIMTYYSTTIIPVCKYIPSVNLNKVDMLHDIKKI